MKLPRLSGLVQFVEGGCPLRSPRRQRRCDVWRMGRCQGLRRPLGAQRDHSLRRIPAMPQLATTPCPDGWLRPHAAQRFAAHHGLRRPNGSGRSHWSAANARPQARRPPRTLACSDSMICGDLVAMAHLLGRAPTGDLALVVLADMEVALACSNASGAARIAGGSSCL